ncbi:FAD assembly factor SdhE [Thalassotalea agariperforans]
MSLLNNKARLRWACRRGMLELDVLFLPFVDEAYDQLSENQKLTFERLLEGDDPDLFAWFMGHQECKDAELNDMVQLILNRVKV